jgi:hypothetical protein
MFPFIKVLFFNPVMLLVYAFQNYQLVWCTASPFILPRTFFHFIRDGSPKETVPFRYVHASEPVVTLFAYFPYFEIRVRAKK